jgi:hypothetical protein
MRRFWPLYRQSFAEALGLSLVSNPLPLALALAIPAIVRSESFCTSTFAKLASNASRIFLTSSLSVTR